MAADKYATFDHDQHGHVTAETDPGRVYFDADAGRVVCSVHGDACATDGSLLKPVTENVLTGADEGGQAIYDPVPKHVGDARLYRCTVCGQGTWSHLA